MAATLEELALELSRSTLEAQERRETQLREKATSVLAAASVVVPIAALAAGRGPALAAVPFAAAALAYFFCARACGAALSCRDLRTGLLGSEMLRAARAGEAQLQGIQAGAASYLDAGYRYNQAILDSTAEHVRNGVASLTVEILALVVALITILVG